MQRSKNRYCFVSSSLHFHTIQTKNSQLMAWPVTLPIPLWWVSCCTKYYHACNIVNWCTKSSKQHSTSSMSGNRILPSSLLSHHWMRVPKFFRPVMFLKCNMHGTLLIRVTVFAWSASHSAIMLPNSRYWNSIVMDISECCLFIN